MINININIFLFFFFFLFFLPFSVLAESVEFCFDQFFFVLYIYIRYLRYRLENTRYCGSFKTLGVEECTAQIQYKRAD